MFNNIKKNTKNINYILEEMSFYKSQIIEDQSDIAELQRKVNKLDGENKVLKTSIKNIGVKSLDTIKNISEIFINKTTLLQEQLIAIQEEFINERIEDREKKEKFISKIKSVGNDLDCVIESIRTITEEENGEENGNSTD